MRLTLAAAAIVAVPLVAAFAEHGQQARHMQYVRQAPPVSPPAPSNGPTTPAPPPPGPTTSATHAPPPPPPPAPSPPGKPGPPPPPAPAPSNPAPAPPPAGSPPPPGQTAPPAPVPTTTFSFSLLATNPTAVPLSNIVSTAVTAQTRPLDTTEPAGAQPTFIPGAPALPNIALLNPANYPALDKTPPTDSPEVQQWKQDVANSGFPIPAFDPTVAGGCPTNAAAASDPNRCWWTCGGCTRSSDIVECPQAKHWGLTYDDGPAFYTPDLLNYLDEKQLKSTFFVVGSRVISLPAMLQTEYMGQHQIAVHTWSHASLTTLTNDQIIAELGWSKKVIKDVIGVTPNMMRPPFGDIDDRVRAISLAMGLTPVMWTRISPLATFDTDDFNIHSGVTPVGQVLQNWQNILANVSTRSTGFIVLEHDLFQQSVEVATGYILPDAMARGLTIQPVSSCLSRPLANAYIETNDNSTNPPPSAPAVKTVLGSGPTTNIGSGAAATGAPDGQSSSAAGSIGFGTAIVGSSVAGLFASLLTFF